MKMRYFIELSYKGSAYHGWQRQINAPSVQQTLENAISLILRSEISVTGAGRTDTGVHAAYYMAHFDCPDGVILHDDFIYHLNAVLPEDIAARKILRVTEQAHARFDALQREYKYFIISRKDPFRRDVSWQYYIPLDEIEMNKAACALLEADDFTTFSKLHSPNKTNICKVSYALWKREGDELVFTIRSDRFLRNMVRSIVGTLVDVGRGKITADQFTALLAARDRSKAATSAPAQGLFLTEIIYPEDIFKNTDTVD